MIQEQSPWLSAPWVDRLYPTLENSMQADVVVVWWWIAGCMSAFFLLHNTNRNVVLLEWKRIARGASGHNAWQIDVFFETPVKELIEAYWVDMTRSWYQAMFDARRQLEEVIATTQRQWQYAKYIGYNAYTTEAQLLQVCEQLALFDQLWLEVNEFFVREDFLQTLELPAAYKQYANSISKEQWDALIWSSHLDRVCFEATHYATVNSATLCHAVVAYMMATYPERFEVYENTVIQDIHTDQWVILHTEAWYKITAHDVVLCTNAYHAYAIDSKQDITHVESVKWYMAWYYISWAKVPSTLWYQPPSHSYTEWYYYHSVRHFYDMDHTERTLVSLWWPDVENPTPYYPEWYKQDLDAYIKNFYATASSGNYYRSGDMWYTDTGLRKIWPHPTKNHIWYNLWCNGVGILWSIHGGRKVSRLLAWDVMEKSIFDVR